MKELGLDEIEECWDTAINHCMCLARQAAVATARPFECGFCHQESWPSLKCVS